MQTVLHVTPEFPPNTGGVGDYANLLARELGRRHEIESVILICDSAQTERHESGLVRTTVLSRANPQAFLSAIQHFSDNARGLIVHYSGYGYEKRGIPFWLAGCLREFRRAFQHIRVLVMFHELFATGPFWNSSFWLSPIQRSVIRRIVAQSDALITNRQGYANWLRDSSRSDLPPVTVLPVFSNLGEPGKTLPPSQRQSRMILYTRGGMYDSEKELLTERVRKIARMARIQQILVMGHWQSVPKDLAPIVTPAGRPSPEEASILLSEAKLGYLDYSPEFLGKSGIFAAFSAHEICSILHRSSVIHSDGLLPQRHFLEAEHIPPDMGNPALIDTIARTAWSWYQAHSLPSTADAYASILSEAPAG